MDPIEGMNGLIHTLYAAVFSFIGTAEFKTFGVKADFVSAWIDFYNAQKDPAARPGSLASTFDAYQHASAQLMDTFFDEPNKVSLIMAGNDLLAPAVYMKFPDDFAADRAGKEPARP